MYLSFAHVFVCFLPSRVLSPELEVAALSYQHRSNESEGKRIILSQLWVAAVVKKCH
jgi:hypothetical protein